MNRVVIAAGGTGGHISPGIALAEELSSRKEEFAIDEIFFHAPERNRDYPDFIKFPWTIIWHGLPQINGNYLLFFLKFIFTLIRTLRIFYKKDIDTVIAMGGYSSIPAILYAVFFRKKLYLCEQNVIPGKFNWYFKKKSRNL